MYAFYGPAADFMMSTPIFSILGKGSELTESFLDNFLKKTERKNSGNFRIFRKSIWKRLRTGTGTENPGNSGKRGIEVYKVKVNIEGEETQANLVLKTENSQEERKELKDALVEEWGLKENRICIQIVRNESGKMGNPVAHRSTSGSSGDACIQ